MNIRDMFDPSSADDDPQEFLSLRGSVEVTAFADDAMTQALWTTRRNNLVVRLARRVMSRIVGGLLGPGPHEITTTGGTVTVGSVSDLVIQYMRWGDAGHDPSNPSQGLPVSPLAESLGNALEVTPGVFEKPVTVDYPTDRSVRFTGTLLKAEPVTQPVNLSEEALYCGNPGQFAFAIYNHGQLSKNNTIALRYRHTLVF